MIENQFEGFKPVFGNVQHIRILEKITEYNKLRVEYQEILKARNESAALRKKCVEAKAKVKALIKFANENRA